MQAGELGHRGWRKLLSDGSMFWGSEKKAVR